MLKVVRFIRFWLLLLFPLLMSLSITQLELSAQSIKRIAPVTPTGRLQPYQSPFNCLPCHERQFRENRQNLKSGYRNASPTFSGLELAGNFLAQGAVEANPDFRNLRPVYPPEINMVTAMDAYQNANQLRAGFCLGCHNGPIIGLGDNNDINFENVAEREVPTWDGRLVPLDRNDPNSPRFIDGQNIRPLRDYHLVDAQGQQVLPEEFGGPPPPGAFPSLGAAGTSCDHCHNVVGPALNRSLQGDGFANTALRLLFTSIKVGPFKNAFPVRGNFHQSTNDDTRINYMVFVAVPGDYNAVADCRNQEIQLLRFCRIKDCQQYPTSQSLKS